MASASTTASDVLFGFTMVRLPAMISVVTACFVAWSRPMNSVHDIVSAFDGAATVGVVDGALDGGVLDSTWVDVVTDVDVVVELSSAAFTGVRSDFEHPARAATATPTPQSATATRSFVMVGSLLRKPDGVVDGRSSE